MPEEKIVNDQPSDEDRTDSPSAHQDSDVSRRDFLQQTIAVASSLGLLSMLPGLDKDWWIAEAQQPNCNPAAPGQPLQSIMEIKSAGSGPNKILKAVLKVLDENKVYLGSPRDGSQPSCNSGQMRYISGYDASLPPPQRQVWPTKHGVPGPAPTLRASVGDTVQITLLNHVNTKNFPNTLDVAEHGQACDQNTTFGQGNTYPGNPSWENPPNCFHGSSSTNLHFHGTHTSPSGVADNILLNIRPSPLGPDGKPVVNEQTVAAIFQKIFDACMHGHQPMLWTDWPPEWQAWQQKLLIQYDNTTSWQGQSPPPGGNGPPVLPQDEQLWFQNQQEMKPPDPGLPQYYVGGFPNCFSIPKWNGQPTSMGQAPGTHWYHSHKHGSTALNLANGMAGALIIEGDYDATLRSYYQGAGQPLKEQVLVLQQFSAVLGLLRAQGKFDLVSVNGQYQPVLQMKPNETQLWRIVNACHQASVPLNRATPIKWVQTAQDGVQLNPSNYNPDPNAETNQILVPARAVLVDGKWLSTGSLAPGNRVDLLVQAPSAPDTYPVTFGGGNTLLLKVNVTGSPVTAIPFPKPGQVPLQFPEMPLFLSDIKPPVGMVKREIRFATTRTQTPGPSPVPTPFGRNPSNATAPFIPNAAPTHTINGKQFSGEVDQYMKLGATEEWNLFNDTPTQGAAHPFHIHINPFQVIALFDPAYMNASLASTGVPMKEPWVWWDTFAIPTGGWVKVWTRFVDYTGKYVFHCHILGHEDRGMMQLVEVIPGVTPMKHK
jgi:FtsP/CotA-like multicopper oxidase with cupredoxin domain